MLASALASALDLPFVCTSDRGIFGMTRTLQDAQQHCQNSATNPLSRSRHGRRWIAQGTRTCHTTEQIFL
jgi:hypothetical protein